jgi:GNAT superfamily N-acetyltransferase
MAERTTILELTDDHLDDTAALLAERRGSGAGRLLGERVLAWARDAGYPTVVTDWRRRDLTSSRTWPRPGFRPTFDRLLRGNA